MANLENYRKLYYRLNKSRILAQMKESYWQNLEESRRKLRKQYWSNPERTRRMAREYAEKNRDKIKERRRERHPPSRVLKIWTLKEVSLLKQIYQTSRWEDLERTFTRSRSAIRDKAQRLGIATPPYGVVEPLPTLSLSETEKAYIAGIIDGEASVALYQQKSGISAQVSINNTDKELMDRLGHLLSPVINDSKIRSRNPHHRTIYILYSRSVPSCKTLLETVLPYLIVKRKNAELVLKWCNMRLAKPRHASHTPEELILVEQTHKK